MKWQELAFPGTAPAKSVAMVNYKDMVVVATEWGIYVIKDGKSTLAEFEVQEIARK